MLISRGKYDVTHFSQNENQSVFIPINPGLYTVDTILILFSFVFYYSFKLSQRRALSPFCVFGTSGTPQYHHLGMNWLTGSLVPKQQDRVQSCDLFAQHLNGYSKD